MLNNYLWLPILFIIHDFEEIILVPKWVSAHKKELSLMKRPTFGGITNSSVLSVAVLEELLLLIGVSLYSSYTDSSTLYFYVMVAYTVHLVLHLIICFQYHGYVPGVATAIIQLPFLLKTIHELFLVLKPSLFSFFFYSLVLVCILLLNVLILHKLMNRIAKSNFLTPYK